MTASWGFVYNRDEVDHQKRSQSEAGGVIERLIRGEKNSENEDKEPQLHSILSLD